MRPGVGYRQWVLSFEGPLAQRLGFDQALLTELAGALARAVMKDMRWAVKERHAWAAPRLPPFAGLCTKDKVRRPLHDNGTRSSGVGFCDRDGYTEREAAKPMRCFSPSSTRRAGRPRDGSASASQCSCSHRARRALRKHTATLAELVDPAQCATFRWWGSCSRGAPLDAHGSALTA